MRNSKGILLCVLALVLGLALPAFTEEGSGVTPEAALKNLQDGNARFVDGKAVHPNADQARRTLTVEKGQHPFAAILGCADSRAPLEVVFDQGIGDLFVVRVAGNVSATDEIGTLEYGVEHLGTPLIVVLGHTQCGAVTAVATKAKVEGNVAKLVAPIKPAVATARKAHKDLNDKDLVPYAIEANVWQSVADLFAKSPVIREAVEKNKVQVVGALYDLSTGQVKWLGNHPDQAKLLVVKKAKKGKE